MSTAELSSLRTQLTDRLDGVERRVQFLTLARGLGFAAVAVAATLTAGLLVDLLWDVSSAVRAGLLGSFLVVAAGACWRWVLRPLWRQSSAAEVAALVESRHPELQERLTSAIELSDPDVPEKEKGSALMRELLLKQTQRVVAQVNVSDAAAAGGAARWGAAGITAVIALLVPLLFAGGTYRLLLSRFFAPFDNLDRATNLYFEVENGDRTVARGSDVEIAAVPRWRVSAQERPDEVWLNWHDLHGDADARPMVWNEERGAYLATLPHVFHPFLYDVSGDGARTREYRIDVVEPPALTALSLTVTPPPYTGQPDEVVDGAVGEVVVFEGSRLALRMQFNKPVAEAVVRWAADPLPASDGAAQPAPVVNTLAAALSPERTTATLELVPQGSGRYAIDVRDEFGLPNTDEPVRRIRVLADAPPTLYFTDRNEQPMARPIDIVRVPVAAADDIGVAALELHYEIVAGGTGSGVIEVEPSILGGRTIDYVFLFDLKPLQLADGSVVSVRARAADERPSPGPNETWTDPRLIHVGKDADPYGAQEIVERQQQLREIMAQLRQAVLENRDDVEDLRQDAAKNQEQQQPFGRDAEIPPLAQTERDIAQRLEQLAALFDLHPLFANLAERTRQVGREPLTQSAQRMDHAALAALPEKTGDLQQTVAQLTAAADILQSLEGEFEQLAELEQDLLELQRLADQTERLARDVAGFDSRRTAQRPNQSESQQEARRQQLAAEQQQLLQDHQQLTGDLDGLLEKRPELVDAALEHELDRLGELARQAAAMADREERLAESLRSEAGERAGEMQDAAQRQQQVLDQAEKLASRPELAAAQAVDPLDVEQLRRALEELKAGNPQAASVAQESAARALERLAEELAKNGQLSSDPREAARELAERERALQEEMQQGDEPRGLAAAQAAIRAAAAQLPTPRAAQPTKEQAVAAATEAVAQLREDQPQQAAAAAAQAAEQLELLAEQIGTPEERRAQALAEVESLREEQRAIAAEVADTLQDRPDDGADVTARRLGELAPLQERLTDRLDTLDAPGAEPARQEAAARTAQARQDLSQPATDSAGASQQQAEQSLADLEQALSGRPSAAEAVAALQPRQQQVAGAAREAGEKSDRDALAAQAAAQRRLAEELGRVQAPAAADEQQSAETQAGAAAEALTKSAEDASQTPEALAAVDRAAEALRELGEQLQASPGGDNPSPSAPPNGSELAQAAWELARQQRALAQQSSKSQGRQSGTPPGTPQSPSQDPAATPPGERPASESTAESTPTDPAEMLREQGELSRQAAELALESARRTGPQSPSTQQAREFAQQAAQAAEQASSGQLSEAGQSAAQAAESAQQAAGELQQPQQGSGEAQPELARQAGQLAQRQQQAAEQLSRAAQSPAQRQAAQQQGQQQLAQAAQELSRQLAEARERLASEPIGRQEQAERAEQSRQAAQQAREAMQSAATQLSQGDVGQASQSAQQAAEALRQAAGQSPSSPQQQAETQSPSQNASPSDQQQQGSPSQSGNQGQNSQGQSSQAQGQQSPGQQGPGQQGQGQQGQGQQGQGQQGQGQQGQGQQGQGQQGQGRSPIPGEVGGQVSEAARQLREAGQQLANADLSGGSSPGNAAGEPSDAAEGADGMPGEGEGQGQGEMPGEGEPSMAESGQGTPSEQSPGSAAQALQEAASALQQAAGKLQPSSGRSQQPGAPSQSQNMASQSGNPGNAENSTQSGSGTRQGLSLSELDVQLQQMSTRNWGELPGTLQTELQNTSRKRPDGDYARLIKLYFEEISRRQTPKLPDAAREE